jgi:hypothetical protein
MNIEDTCSVQVVASGDKNPSEIGITPMFPEGDF